MDDLISRKALLEAYDKAHKGPPGGARKLIEEAPRVLERDEGYPKEMADKDRNEITPELCAKGLRHIAQRYNLNYAEVSAIAATIDLLIGSHDDFLYQPTDWEWEKPFYRIHAY